MAPKKLLLLTGNCSHKGCGKRSIYAKKLTRDVWVEFCDSHAGKTISLDIDKIGLYIDPARIAAQQ